MSSGVFYYGFQIELQYLPAVMRSASVMCLITEADACFL